MSTDVTMLAGESLRLDVLVTNLDGTVRDITDDTLEFNIFDSPQQYNLIYTGNAGVLSGVDGTATASLTAEDTNDSPFSVLYYQVVLNEDTDRYVIQDGKLTIQAGYNA